jgi:sec-independent protein translocase protein TatC
MATLLQDGSADSGQSRGPSAAAGKEMTLTEHLQELRRRVMITLAFFVVAATFSYFAYGHILTFFLNPYCRTVPARQCALYITSPLDAFTIRLEVTGYGGLFLTLPLLLFELWRFVTPGLRANERRYALPFVFATVAFFCFGAYVAILTFPHALGFFRAVGGPQLKEIYSPQKYLGLIMLLMTIFGATFEFPVILVALELAGVVKSAVLVKWQRGAIVTIVIVAAIITPSSDPFSLFAMAVPLVVFYEAAIVVGKLLHK